MRGALGSRRQPHVPRRDDRDRSGLPEALMAASYHMALLLRYEAPNKRLADHDGWVDVQVVLKELQMKHGIQLNNGDILKVVETSFSKEQPRFEKREGHGGFLVRAANIEHYRSRNKRGGRGRGPRDFRDDRSDCSDWSDTQSFRSYDWGWRQSTGSCTRARDWRPSFEAGGGLASGSSVAETTAPSTPSTTDTAQHGAGHEPWPSWRTAREGSSGGTAAHDSPGATGASSAAVWSFEGAWTSKEARNRIHGQNLVWTVNGEDMKPEQVLIKGNEIWVPEGDKHIKGCLAYDGRTIQFDDGDVWRKCEEQVGLEREAAVADTGARDSSSPVDAVNGGAAPCASSCSAPADTGGSQDDSGNHAADHDSSWEYWVEMRVKENWDATAYGSEYLSLHKGELLSVKPGLDQGWALGYSMQAAAQGWFPPDYAYTENA